MGRTALDDFINEKSTPIVAFKIVDQDGVGFKPETLRLTLYDRKTNTIINSRDAQDVLDNNDVLTDIEGNTTWHMQVLDNIIVTATLTSEEHIALWHWTWNDGEDSDYYELIIRVRNMNRVS